MKYNRHTIQALTDAYSLTHKLSHTWNQSPTAGHPHMNGRTTNATPPPSPGFSSHLDKMIASLSKNFQQAKFRQRGAWQMKAAGLRTTVCLAHLAHWSRNCPIGTTARPPLPFMSLLKVCCIATIFHKNSRAFGNIAKQQHVTGLVDDGNNEGGG